MDEIKILKRLGSSTWQHETYYRVIPSICSLEDLYVCIHCIFLVKTTNWKLIKHA